MKAIILCAGLGTRLGNLTKHKPKPTIEIYGKPILAHLADHLKIFGITEIYVNLHYLPLEIMKHFGNRFVYSYEPELLGEEKTIDSLSRWIEKDFCVVMNGDTLTNVNIAKMFQMSQGRNVRFMDSKDKTLYAGTRIITPYYWLDHKDSVIYQDDLAYWIDMGTPEGLAKARKMFE